MSEEISVLEKVAGGLVLLLVFYIVLRSVVSHGMPFLRGVRRGDQICVAVLGAVMIGVTVKFLDDIERSITSFGYALSDRFLANTFAVEEVMELGVSMTLAVAIFSHFRCLSPDPGSPKPSDHPDAQRLTGWQA